MFPNFSVIPFALGVKMKEVDILRMMFARTKTPRQV